MLKESYKIAGYSGLFFGLTYLIIIGLFLLAGELPQTLEERFDYFASHQWHWWGIVGFSVISDFLIIPFLWGTVVSFKLSRSYNLVFYGSILIAFFVVMDLAITWPNYVSLINCSIEFKMPSTANQQIQLAIGNYANQMISSALLTVYIILIPSIGIFLIGVGLLREGWYRALSYSALLAGGFGIVAVVGPFIFEPLKQSIIFSSLLTMVWVTLGSYEHLKLAKE